MVHFSRLYLVHFYKPIDTYTYTYDPNGNMTSKVKKIGGETTTYTYNSEDQLIGVVTPIQIVSYKYDALGRRIKKNVSGTITRYVYEGEDIIQELDGNNQIIATYTHGPEIDEPILVEKNGQKYYYISDGLGSITAIVDQNGNIAQTYRYDSFGNIINQTGSLNQPYTYTGREYDSETELYYYRARYYDAKIGRFLQEDPIGFVGGINKYAYVYNNPLNLVDPYGLVGWVDFLAAFSDSMTFGLAKYARGEGNNAVNFCSGAYSAGWWTGVGYGIAMGGVGSLNAGGRTVLYSGEGAKDAAIGAKGAGMILADTIGGRALNAIDRIVELPQPVWKFASRIFASNAKGEVQIFLRNPSINRIYATVERPTLDFWRNTISVYR